jgi:hypothetical protein
LGLIFRSDRTLPRSATAFVELIQRRTQPGVAATG